MDSTRISQQTSTTIPVHGDLVRDAPRPRALLHASFRGPLQWALEGPGWDVLRPAVDFLALLAAVVLAFGASLRWCTPRALSSR